MDMGPAELKALKAKNVTTKKEESTKKKVNMKELWFVMGIVAVMVLITLIAS